MDQQPDQPRTDPTLAEDAEAMRLDVRDHDVDGAVHDWEGDPDADGDSAAERDAAAMNERDDTPNDVAFGDDVAATFE